MLRCENEVNFLDESKFPKMLFFWHFYLTAAIIILNIFVGRISAIWPFSTGTKSTPKDIFSTNSVDSLINSNFINSNEPRRQSSLTRKTEDPFVGRFMPWNKI